MPYRLHTIGIGGLPETSHLISTLSPTVAVVRLTSNALSRDITETPRKTKKKFSMIHRKNPGKIDEKEK